MYLQQLCHDNLVNMIEVFRQRKRFYLVFEYLDHTLLDELERIGNGLGWEVSKRHVYQILRGLSFCHSRNVSGQERLYSVQKVRLLLSLSLDLDDKIFL